MSTDGFECDLYFIRHGESESNTVPGLAAGRNWNSPMTPRGFEQARALGERLKNDGVVFDRVYSSSLTRAVQTTETMLEAMGLPGDGFERVDEIIERQVPAWRGKRLEETNTPEALRQWAERGKWFVPGDGDGESERAVERRFSNWLEDTVISDVQQQEAGRQTVAIVSHGFAILAIVSTLLGMKLQHFQRIRHGVGAFARLDFDGDRPTLISVNETWHLDGRVPENGPESDERG